MATSLLPHMQKKNYERLQKALDSVMSIREMTQVRQCGPAPPMALVGPMWDALMQDPSLGAAFLVITIHARLGGCQGSHSHPLSPLPGVLPGDQEADGQIGPPGPSPPAVVRLRVLRPHPTAP